jgi:transposase
MVKAIDEVYQEEHPELKKVGDERLVGSKYLWLYLKENLQDKNKLRFQSLKQLHLKIGRGWAIRESLTELWPYRQSAWAIRHFKGWFFWAAHLRLEPVIEKTRLFWKYLRQILKYFRYRITNVFIEGLNSKIKNIRKMAHGFLNRAHFKVAIYYHCGGLNIYPVIHRKTG